MLVLNRDIKTSLAYDFVLCYSHEFFMCLRSYNEVWRYLLELIQASKFTKVFSFRVRNVLTFKVFILAIKRYRNFLRKNGGGRIREDTNIRGTDTCKVSVKLVCEVISDWTSNVTNNLKIFYVTLWVQGSYASDLIFKSVVFPGSLAGAKPLLLIGVSNRR